MKMIKLVCVAVGLMQLVACGGGGSSSNAPATATTGACANAANCALPGSVSAVPPQN